MYNKAQVRKQIIQYLKAVGSGENIVQAIKEALFLNEQFNPLLLFELLSRGKQKITRDDWKNYLIKRNIRFSDKEIRYFFRHCRLGEEATLNQFLEIMIPYNADVLRQFKAKYLQSLQIEQLSPEIEFIFIELMKHWIDFFRNLIEIRSELSRSVNKRQIQHLVKQDLVLQSKPRESRKFHEAFQQSTFSLSFNQIRKFLQLWISQQQLNHEFYLLNVKRHIKSDDPFRRIVYRTRKNNRSRSRSRSVSVSASRSISNSRSVSRRKQGSGKRRRSVSAKKRDDLYSQREMVAQMLNGEEDEFSNIKRNKQSKYDDFKKQLQNSLLKQEFNMGQKDKQPDNKNPENKRRNIRFEQKRHNNESDQEEASHRKNEIQFSNQYIQKGAKDTNARPAKKQTNIRHTQIIVKMLQQIVLKQDRIEKLRKQLAKTTDFSINCLFSIIDSNNKGFIRGQDLIKYYPDGVDFCESIVNFYARSRDQLKLQQFSSIFRPLSKELNEKLESRQNARQNTFKKQTNRLIFEILQLEGEMHTNLNALKDRIKKQGVNPRSLFDYLDGEGKGYITSDNIKQILESNNINTQPKDIKCLMKLFRKRIEERILEKEFLHFIDF